MKTALFAAILWFGTPGLIFGAAVIGRADTPGEQGIAATGGQSCTIAISTSGRVSGQCSTPSATATPAPSPSATAVPSPSDTPTPAPTGTPSPTSTATSTPPASGYPLHTGITATSFWVGEIACSGPNCSQEVSAYDGQWEAHYGGCDGGPGADPNTGQQKPCETERRSASNGYFPLRMTPLENPFYLDVPFSDVSDPTAFAERCRVVPWAQQVDPTGAHCGDAGFSYLKNRWVKVTGPNGQTCYGQIEDAGPGQYHDAAYVFGATNARPANRSNNNDGMDVSPALNGCLGFAALDGDSDTISWQFVDDAQVPAGPWLRIVTTSGVSP